MENHLGQVYVKNIELTRVDINGMSIQELLEHRFGLIRLRNKPDILSIKSTYIFQNIQVN